MRSMNYICGLLCCPPTITSIANKISFLPPPPSYLILERSDGYTIKLLGNSNKYDTNNNIEPYLIKDDHNNNIAIISVKLNTNPKYWILYSHGNAVDIGLSIPILMELSQILNCNFIAYDYNGYGCSTGKASVSGINENIKCVHQFMNKKLMINDEDIVLYGQSIGSVPTVYLGSLFKLRGLIIHSGLASGLRMMFNKLNTNLFFDVYKNCELIKNIFIPVLIIHGSDDDIIPLNHGYLLYDNCPMKVQPLWANGYGHNDIELSPEYVPTLRRFVNIDLK